MGWITKSGAQAEGGGDLNKTKKSEAAEIYRNIKP